MVRPPATEAHYHNPESDKLLTTAINRFVSDPGARVLLLPRNKRQEAALRSAWAVRHCFATNSDSGTRRRWSKPHLEFRPRD